MYYFVDAVCSIAEIFFLIFLAGCFFPPRTSRIWVKAISYVVFGVFLLLLSVNPDLTTLRTVYWIVGGTILLRFIFHAKYLSSLFASLSFIVITGFTELAVMVVLSFFGLDSQAAMQIGNTRLLCTIISHMIELFLIVMIRVTKGLTTGSLSAKILLPVCPCLIISIILCCLLASDVSRGYDMNPLYLVVAIGLLYTCIIIILYTSRLQEQQTARHDLELSNHHYAMQKEYYEQLHSQQEQTRALWHDIKKYVRAIEADTAGESSIEQLQSMVDSVPDVVDVNNRVVSIILNEYVQIARDTETTLSMDVQIPSQLPVTAADIYILLGNTLDNAFDACAELPQEEREITLKLRLHNQMLFYRISNPFLPSHLNHRKNQFHGYGLKNVQECVKRNNGSMEITTENNTFVLTALINCI